MNNGENGVFYFSGQGVDIGDLLDKDFSDPIYNDYPNFMRLGIRKAKVTKNKSLEYIKTLVGTERFDNRFTMENVEDAEIDEMDLYKDFSFGVNGENRKLFDNHESLELVGKLGRK